MDTLKLIIFGVGALIFVGLISFIARLYRRSSSELSFVRTGQGNAKVVRNGGAIVLPVLHDIIWVNMNTLRLEVMRSKEEALITKDRLRVDVRAEFYVRVAPDAQSITNAATTLGQKTLKPLELKELIEGKFVDALRSVAAEMTMEELHEQRSDFVQRVQTAVTGDLIKNGLELETVSLTSLDQTSRDFFNPNNAFDAQGLTKLTEEIEMRRKQRNAIEQDTQVEVARKNLDAHQQRLTIQREAEYAQIEQQRELEIRKAEQSTEIALQRAGKDREQQEGEIAAKLVTDSARIESERSINERNIEAQRIVREREIARAKSIELAEQEKAIAIAGKSKAQSEAQAEADNARALAARAEEQVATARATEIAERTKQIDLIEAQKGAQRQAIGITVAAEAEKKAAQDHAEAQRIKAQGEADAEKVAADAAAIRYAVDAEGKRQINDAENMLSAEIIEQQIKMAMLKALPDIIRESVKPMENIEGIKILQVNGLGGPTASSGSNGSSSNGGNGNLAEEVVNNALRYRAQAPILDSLLSELGLEGGDLGSLVQGATQTSRSAPKPVTPQAPKIAPRDGNGQG